MMVAAPPEAPPIKVALRCGDCGKKLAVVPPELLDKGIEIKCKAPCHKVNVFD